MLLRELVEAARDYGAHLRWKLGTLL